MVVYVALMRGVTLCGMHDFNIGMEGRMTPNLPQDVAQDRSSEFRRRESRAVPVRIDAGLWRRGPAPVAAGARVKSGGVTDQGYFGPDSIVWKVFTHPAVAALEVQVTALLQFTHAGMSANMMDHDPLYAAAARSQATAAMVVSRHRRTFGVVVPTVLGDRASADRIGAHIHKFHGHMKGIIPGTDHPYDAAGPELVLYGHVTIMHAALRIYERVGYHGYRSPRRLCAADRDRYWKEAAPFAVLMGARESDVPRSVAEVRAYYVACASCYFNQSLMLRRTAAMFWAILRQPSQWHQHPSDAATVLALIASHFLALGVIPRPARRHWGMPRAADPVIDVFFRVARPAFALLGFPRIGNRILAWMAGPDGFELVKNAKALRSQPSTLEISL